MALREKYSVVNVFVSAVTPENISRQQLLAWVNDTLQSNLTKIEEMSNGAAYCLMTDRLFPGSVPLRKVKWNPRSEVDSIANWKILQNAWHELGINKPVQVQTLMKAKFQDNFEFLQWFRRFYDNNNAGYEYDPLAARNHEEFPISASLRSSKMPTARNSHVTAAAPPPRRTAAAPAAKPNVSSTRATLATTARPQTTTVTRSKAELSAEAEAKYKNKIAELTEQVTTWENSIGAIEKERDFYYTRLHRLELLCNELGSGQSVSVDDILSILYQSEVRSGCVYVDFQRSIRPDSDDSGDLQEFEAVEDEVLSNQDRQSNVDMHSNAGDHEQPPATAPSLDLTSEKKPLLGNLDESTDVLITEKADNQQKGDNKTIVLDETAPLDGTFVKETDKSTNQADDSYDLLDQLGSLNTNGTKPPAKIVVEEQDSY
ncbi:EBF3-S protein [Aphelenchoides besseyi]|nr:EBF3-S protein [Aphelenchoides besseyi]